MSIGVSGVIHLIGHIFYDADGFLQFQVLIRVLELISVPNHSRDSFILIKFNTLSSWREIDRVHWNLGSNSLNWTYLYDADEFLQFRVLIRVLELISVPELIPEIHLF